MSPHLGTCPANDKPDQPPLLRRREVLFEQGPQLGLLTCHVSLQAHAHRRARSLQSPLHLEHRGGGGGGGKGGGGDVTSDGPILDLPGLPSVPGLPVPWVGRLSGGVPSGDAQVP
jgi:hypothetical protein